MHFYLLLFSSVADIAVPRGATLLCKVVSAKVLRYMILFGRSVVVSRMREPPIIIGRKHKITTVFDMRKQIWHSSCRNRNGVAGR